MNIKPPLVFVTNLCPNHTTRVVDPQKKSSITRIANTYSYVLNELNNPVAYNTLVKYCVKNFGSKVKVARKYHAKKDPARVDTFKKTSLKSVKKQKP